MNNKIELHTIATFQGKEYELEKLLNNLLNMLEEKDKEIQRLNNIINELEKASDEIFHKYPYERHQWFLKLKELKGSDK